MGQVAAGELGSSIRRENNQEWQVSVKLLPKTNSTNFLQPSLTRQWRFLDLFRAASTKMLIQTGVAVAAAWVPLFLLCAYRGSAAFLSFLKDYASQSRFLIILPMLILAEHPLHSRLSMVARHFETYVVPEDQTTQFQAIWVSHERDRNSKLARILGLALTYATAAWLFQFLSPRGSEFVSWWTGGGGFKAFSPAGTWAFCISYPILVYYTYLWLWRQVLWARFLHSTSLLNLRLIAAHPDHLGGLGFLEASMLGQLPFSFCMGIGLAGAVANRVLNEGQALLAFRYLAPILIAAVLLVCVAPYFFFTRTLMLMRRRGMSEYGAFAHAVGEQFEKKWLRQSEHLNEDVLTVPDFSATADLFGVVHNIDEIRVVPVGAVDIYAVVIAALIPAIPVVIASIPFNSLIQAAARLMF